MRRNLRNTRNGGFIGQILLIIVIIIIAAYVFTNPYVQFFWHACLNNMDRAAHGQPTDWQLASPVFSQ